RARIEIDADPDVARERRDEVLLQIEAGGLLDSIPQADRVGAGGAGQLAPERLRGGRDARVGSGVSGQPRGEIGRGQQRLEGGHQLVSGEVLALREQLYLEKFAILLLVVDGKG